VTGGSILLVRHGETKWNLQRRYQGRSDSPLTARGVAQAHAIGRLLAAMPGAESGPVVASPLGRARRTAELIREHLGVRPELRLDDRLRELSLGGWDGLTFDEIAARCPGVFDGDGRHAWYFRSPDGETYEAITARVGDWLRDFGDASRAIVVTHGIVSRVLRGLYAGPTREVALTLPVPHDKIFRLSGGAIEEIAVPSQSTAGRG
jgi:broad specificity phosphatase PhoE